MNPVISYLQERYGIAHMVEVFKKYTNARNPEKIINNYANELWALMVNSYNDRERTALISLQDLRLKAGRINLKPGAYKDYNAKQIWLSKFFEQEFPVYTVESLGYNVNPVINQMLSKIKLHMAVQPGQVLDARTKAYMDEVTAYETALMFKQLGSGDPDTWIDWILVDVKNLRNFEDNTIRLINKATAENQPATYINTLERNKRTASLFASVAEQYGGYLPQLAERKAHGRFYYKLQNLQNCSKVVRLAALKDTTEIDIENCAVVIKASIVYQEYCKKVLLEKEGYKPFKDSMEYFENHVITVNEFMAREFPCTLEYLDRKGAYRQLIQKTLDPEYWYLDAVAKKAKKLLSMAGFGANVKTAGWRKNGRWIKSSIAELLNPTPNRNDYATDWEYEEAKQAQYRFAASTNEKIKKINELGWFKGYVAEQVKLNEILLDISENYDLPESVTEKGAGSIVTYMYQQLERDCIESVKEILKKRYDITPILTVHDAVYCNRDIPPKAQAELRKHIREQLPVGGDIEVEHHTNHYASYHTLVMEELHYRLVKQEQERARQQAMMHKAGFAQISAPGEEQQVRDANEMLMKMDKMLNRQEKMIREGVLQLEDDDEA